MGIIYEYVLANKTDSLSLSISSSFKKPTTPKQTQFKTMIASDILSNTQPLSKSPLN